MTVDPAGADWVTGAAVRRDASFDDRVDPAIRVVDHDPVWAIAGVEERARLRTGLGSLVASVDHIGSTAVPGLAAKPVIDLLVTVESTEPPGRYVAALESLGYTYQPYDGDEHRRFFGRPARRPRTHHVHLCRAGGEEALRHLAVRDYLRAHPAEVARYAALKRDLASAHHGDRLAYIDGKRPYLTDLERRALDWAHAEGR